MLNLNKIEEEILNLEKKDTTYAVIERLAWLYTVRDHMKEYEEQTTTAAAIPPSKFMEIIGDKHPDDVWCLVEELVESVRITQPMLYDSYMRRFESLDHSHKA